MKLVTGHLDGSALARFWQSLHPSDSAAGVVVRFITRFVHSLASNRKAARMWGLGALAVFVACLGSLVLWRSAAKAEPYQAPISPSRETARISHGGAAALAGGGAAASTPTFSADYRILLSRSIFAIGGQSAGSRSTGSTAGPALSQGASAAGNWLFLGILGEDSRISAFVEDTAAKRFVEAHVGDALGPGYIREVTAHDLAYEVNGKTTRILVGQGLDGTTAVSANPQVAQAASKSGHNKRHHGSGE